MVRKDDDPVPEDPVAYEFKSACSLIVLALSLICLVLYYNLPVPPGN